MHRARRVSVLLIAVALLAGSHAANASAITSRILTVAEGEHTGDFFGTSVAWVGDVNGDGYDEISCSRWTMPFRCESPFTTSRATRWLAPSQTSGSWVA